MTTAGAPSRASLLRRQAPRVVALLIVALTTLWVADNPTFSSKERKALAAHFRFQPLQLTTASHARQQYLYTVEPQLRRYQGWMSLTGAGVALADADMNGLPDDVCSVDPRTESVTLAPAPGTGSRYKPFLLDPRPLPTPRGFSPSGCLPGDFNGDGQTDFLVYYYGRSPVLFLRKPGPALRPDAFVRQELVTPWQRWNTFSITQADLTGNGHNDLVVGNYIPDGTRWLDPTAKHDKKFNLINSFSRAENGGGARIFLWHGARAGATPAATFTQATTGFPSIIQHGWTVAVGAADLSGNGLPDVYLAEDLGPDHLLVNRSTPGHLKLSLVTGSRGFTTPESNVLGKDSFKSMAATFGDLDGNGRLDIFVTNLAERWALMESNYAWMNTGGPLAPGKPAPFKNDAESMGLARGGWGWDAKIGDFDNSGAPQVVQAAGLLGGKLDGWPQVSEFAMGNDQLVRNPALFPSLPKNLELDGQETMKFYVRGSNGRFEDLAQHVPGLGGILQSRAVALADVNGDGRLDFAVANQWRNSYLYVNHSPAGGFLGLDLRLPVDGKPSATRFLPFPARGAAADPAIGATVTIRLPNGHRQIETVDGGNGFSGASSTQLLFGLGAHPPANVPATITWRDGYGHLHRTTVRLAPGWHTILLEQR